MRPKTDAKIDIQRQQDKTEKPESQWIGQHSHNICSSTTELSTRLVGRGVGKGDGAQGRNRTTDTRIFSPLLYRLSYLGLSRLKLASCHVPVLAMLRIAPLLFRPPIVDWRRSGLKKLRFLPASPAGPHPTELPGPITTKTGILPRPCVGNAPHCTSALPAANRRLASFGPQEAALLAGFAGRPSPN